MPKRPTQVDVVVASRAEVLNSYDSYLAAVESGADAIDLALLRSGWRYSTEMWQAEVDELRKDRGWALVGPRPAAYVAPPIAGVRSIPLSPHDKEWIAERPVHWGLVYHGAHLIARVSDPETGVRA